MDVRSKNPSKQSSSILLIYAILIQNIDRPTSFRLGNLPSKVEGHIANLVVVMYQSNMPFHCGRGIRRVSTPLLQEQDEEVNLSLASASSLCCFKAVSVDSSSVIWSSRACLLGTIDYWNDDQPTRPLFQCHSFDLV